MRKKIDWNSYIGKKNKFGVKICDWEEQKEKHTREDKVVCICPECNRYFIASAIRIVVEETRCQIQGCIACGYKRSASKRSKDYSSYFNKPNKYGIVILRWVENKSIHTNQDKVVCICPDCKKEFVSTLTNLIYEKNKQIKRCINCAARLNGEAFMKKINLNLEVCGGSQKRCIQENHMLILMVTEHQLLFVNVFYVEKYLQQKISILKIVKQNLVVV